MKMEPRIGPEGRDDEVTRELRSIYAPPGGEAFWEALERRILARVTATEDDSWWRQLSRWRRGLALAGAAAILVAGLVAQHSNRERSMAAYREIESSRVVPVQVASETQREASRDVTLRYVMGP
jgi:Anti-sigma-K factor rskA.